MAAPGATAVQGFMAFPIKFSAKQTSCHYLYFKQHQVRELNKSKPPDLTLFVLNVPPYCDEDCIKRLFSVCGKVVKVFFHKNPTSGTAKSETAHLFGSDNKISGFKVAYVVFKKPLGVERALKLQAEEPFVLSTKTNPVLVGIKKWCNDYNSHIPDPKKLQEEVDGYMSMYNQKLKEQEKLEKGPGDDPDDEGWVTVTKQSRKVVARKDPSGTRNIKVGKKKRAQKELVNFYSYQIRESKMEHIAQLRKQFEEAKNKITLMRQTRKFKPY